jgi:hypothetical protein
LKIDKNQLQTSKNSKTLNNLNNNNPAPELIDEEITDSSFESSTLLNPSDLTIEQVVAQCQRLSESIGVPKLKLEQAMTECVDRNSSHLTSPEPLGERDTLVREQCIIAVSQSELLSNEEIKMLVDECVASMTPE